MEERVKDQSVKWFKSLINKMDLHPLTHSHTMTPFDAPGKQAF